MNQQDRDLIVGMIDNSLSPEESEAVRLRLESDAGFSAEYRTQLAVSETLAAAGGPTLSDAERATLRSRLIDQLSLESAPDVPERSPRPGAYRFWKPIVVLSAAAAVIAGFVIIPAMSEFSNDSAEFTTTVAAATAAPEGVDPTTLTDSEPQGVTDPESSELRYDSDEFADVVDVVDAQGADISDLLKAAAGEMSASTVKDSLSRAGYTDSLSIDGERLEICLSEVAAQIPDSTTNILVMGADNSGGTTIAYLGLTMENGIEAAVSVDLSTCRIVSDGN
jgi:hypothetical protein